jgi:hypothetical protein
VPRSPSLPNTWRKRCNTAVSIAVTGTDQRPEPASYCRTASSSFGRVIAMAMARTCMKAPLRSFLSALIAAVLVTALAGGQCISCQAGATTSS